MKTTTLIHDLNYIYDNLMNATDCPDSILGDNKENDIIFEYLNDILNNFKMLVKPKVLQNRYIKEVMSTLDNYITEILCATEDKEKISDVLNYIYFKLDQIHDDALALELFEICANIKRANELHYVSNID